MAGVDDGLAAAGDDGCDDEGLIIASETNDAALIDAMMLTFRLTAREAEVLVWVACFETNRDIGDTLSTRPRTITKHLEHILPRLGLETRSAVAGLVLTRIPGFSQSRGWESGSERDWECGWGNGTARATVAPVGQRQRAPVQVPLTVSAAG